MKKLSPLLAAFAVAGCASLPASTLNEEQQREIDRKTSPVGAMALVKMMFMSEYCRATANGMQGSGIRVAVATPELPGLPDSLYAIEFNYNGMSLGGSTPVPQYCGRLMISGPADGGEAIQGQYRSMTRMLNDVSILAQMYAALPPEKQHTELESAHGRMKDIARSLRAGVQDSLMHQPYLPDGRLNMVGTVYSPPRPLRIDTPFSRALDMRLEQLRTALAEIDESAPIVPPTGMEYR